MTTRAGWIAVGVAGALGLMQFGPALRSVSAPTEHECCKPAFAAAPAPVAGPGCNCPTNPPAPTPQPQPAPVPPLASAWKGYFTGLPGELRTIADQIDAKTITTRQVHDRLKAFSKPVADALTTAFPVVGDVTPDPTSATALRSSADALEGK